MPPGIFKLIQGSKYMRYHQTTPQAHLGGRSHEIPQGNVLGGGSSVNAQVYMRGRPSDYDAWEEALRGENDDPGWGWKDVLPHFRGMEGNNRLHDELHGSDGPLLVSDPGHIDDVSRWFVQAGQALGLPYNHDFNGPSQRGVGFYQFMNRRGPAQQRGLRLPRAAGARPQADDPAAIARAPHRHRERPSGRRRLPRREWAGPHGVRGRRDHRRLRLARHTATADAFGNRPRRAAQASTASTASSICRASAPT